MSIGNGIQLLFSESFGALYYCSSPLFFPPPAEFSKRVGREEEEGEQHQQHSSLELQIYVKLESGQSLCQPAGELRELTAHAGALQ